MATRPVTFLVNGKLHSVANANPLESLLTYLHEAGIKGTKLGCGEGGCGACTVVVSFFNKSLGSVCHRAVNACLMPLCAADGTAITTIEGLKSTTALHPIQERMVKSNAIQCGFCTPGIIMALYAYLLEHPNATESSLQSCLDGNLCRCTGYRPIIDVAKSFARKTCLGTCTTTDIETLPVAPPSIPVEFLTEARTPLFASTPQCSWFVPQTLSELLELKRLHPKAEIVVGNTEVGIFNHFKGSYPGHIIYPANIPELLSFSTTEDGAFIGAALSLTDLEIKLESLIASMDKAKAKIFVEMIRQLERFAGHQVRNVACLGANLATASPTSDMNPILLASGAVVHVASSTGKRTVNISDWFIGYRKVALAPEEVIVSIFVPFTKPNEFVSAFKQSRRLHDDIAVVTACFRVTLQEVPNEPAPSSVTATSAPILRWDSASFNAAVASGSGFVAQPPSQSLFPPTNKKWVVQSCSLAFGAMDARTRLASSTGQFLTGKSWDFSILPGVIRAFATDFPIAAKVPGGMPEYRRTMTGSLFFKFFMDVYANIHGSTSVPPQYLSAAKKSFDRAVMKSVVDFDCATPKCPTDVVGTPVTHICADKLATGEAVFASDVDAPYHAVMIQSSKAHARIVSIDATKALAMEGVLRVFTAKDVPGTNVFPATKDEEVFASSEVLCVGYPVGVVVARTHEIARNAARLVQVQYEELPAVLTIDDAIRTNSWLAPPIVYETGDINAGFKASDHVIEGEMSVNGQEHFYMETNVVVATPREDEIELFCSTQNTSKTQSSVATVLGIPSNAVTVKCKRAGGGFGGKETRNIFVAVACAVPAYIMKKPIKLWMDRDVDMSITGTRHPFLCRYKVGFMNSGKLVAADFTLYSNCGYSLDLSIPVMSRALFHVDNAYFFENLRATGHMAKTNKPSNTAFRGFGAPQGMCVTEQIMIRIAQMLAKPVNPLRELNFYKEGEMTHYGMQVKNNFMARVWAELLEKSEFKKREHEVTVFNAQQRYRKRGIACIPVKFGLAFTQSALNQAGSLVHIYVDGSVLISHGGCEIGQGLHTKMAQICSTALGIPLSMVRVGDTSSDKVPNSSPTAASSQSDLNGMAVLLACTALKERLEKFRATLPPTPEPLPWDKLVQAAYAARVDLCAHGFYETSAVKFDFKTGKGNPFSYFVFGAACSEVEIDTLTGDHTILRSDVVMDIGKSLNPSIDIGQIEGAFIQGSGWSTLEELVNFPNGSYYTLGPSTYKIPGVVDVPSDFRVYILRDVENPMAVHSSKGIGEPPLFLGHSVFFAIQNAITSARAEEGIQGFFQMSLPASCEQIRLACRDAFTDPTPNAGIKGESWTTVESRPTPDDLHQLP